MKFPQVFAASAVALSLAVSGPVLASEHIEQGRAVAVELSENADPAVRAAALITIGHRGDSEQRTALERFKTADTPQERLAAGLALTLAGDFSGVAFTAEQLKNVPRTFEVLRQLAPMVSADTLGLVLNATLTEAPATVSRDIFRFLASQNGALYELLTDRLRSDDEEIRKLALNALVANPRSIGLQTARTLAGHRDAQIRTQVLDITHSLRHRRDLRSELSDILTGLLAESQEEIDQKAARQLVGLGVQSGTDFLVDALEHQDSNKRLDTLRFLLNHDIRAQLSSVQPLIEDLEAEQDYSRRQTEREYLYALAATSRDDAFFENVRQKFQGDIFEDRLVAAGALGLSANPEAVALLQPALREGQSVIRKHAARGLGQLQAAAALGDLRQTATNDRDKEVKIAAIHAIGQIRDVRSVQILRFLVTSNDPAIKAAVTDALVSIGLPEAIQGLEVLIRDRDTSVQWAAFLGILRIDPDQASRHISTALRNPPPTFGADLQAAELSQKARDLLYRRMLTHSTGRVRSLAAQHIDSNRDVLLPLAQDLVVSEEIHRDIRQDLLSVLLSELDDDNLARLDRVMRTFPEEPAARSAAWTLARLAPASFEGSFRGFIARDDSVLKAIAAYALTNID